MTFDDELRAILHRYLNYVTGGKDWINTDQVISEIKKLKEDSLPAKKEVVDKFEGALYDPISRFNEGYNQAIENMKERL